MQVNNPAGLTFESGLRALLRQDPDIIMVGETRDAETASISVRAAITGHLVFSTLHTSDACSSVIRLIDMGVEPYLLTNSVTGVVAQRLMRKVCQSCSSEEEPAEGELPLLGAEYRNIGKVRRARGCHLCNYTGYSGRVAIHEILAVDAGIRRLIAGSASTEKIKDYAVGIQGMLTLRDAAARLVSEGVTTMEEFIKVSYV
jgi:Type II secretory pathway, ATPase PulE/Tfp pilus assembly pathway, ATPase PilB